MYLEDSVQQKLRSMGKIKNDEIILKEGDLYVVENVVSKEMRLFVLFRCSSPHAISCPTLPKCFNLQVWIESKNLMSARNFIPSTTHFFRSLGVKSEFSFIFKFKIVSNFMPSNTVMFRSPGMKWEQKCHECMQFHAQHY